jgi:hypothetical protein
MTHEFTMAAIGIAASSLLLTRRDSPKARVAGIFLAGLSIGISLTAAGYKLTAAGWL